MRYELLDTSGKFDLRDKYDGTEQVLYAIDENGKEETSLNLGFHSIFANELVKWGVLKEAVEPASTSEVLQWMRENVENGRSGARSLVYLHNMPENIKLGFLGDDLIEVDVETKPDQLYRLSYSGLDNGRWFDVVEFENIGDGEQKVWFYRGPFKQYLYLPDPEIKIEPV